MENSYAAFQTLFQCAPFPKSKSRLSKFFSIQGKIPKLLGKIPRAFQSSFEQLAKLPTVFSKLFTAPRKIPRPCEEIPTGFSKFLSIPREADGIISFKVLFNTQEYSQ